MPRPRSRSFTPSERGGFGLQRLRIKFARGEALKFISHLDLTRLWQRALNRARIPLAYSQGFTPHPRILFALPLALGVTSECDLMEIYVTRAVSPHFFSASLSKQLPPGIEVLQVIPVSLTIPSLQSIIHSAEYLVDIETDKPREGVESALEKLLSLETLPWEHQRDTGPHRYDLRALIEDLWVMDYRPGSCRLGMTLRCGTGGAGRPEQVALAAGFKEYPVSIHRTRLVLGTP